MTPSSSEERIKAIGTRIGKINRYLEIGVAKGSTFFKIDADVKHAVDPRFRFDVNSRCTYRNEKYYSMTSDQYFKQVIGVEKEFDLIFLDGLHTFSQTLRDFTASQALAHSKTIWIIDDTVPTDPIAAESNLTKVREARKATGNGDDETWMGDVFKLIVFIHFYYPQYTCLTTEGHGQTVIIPLKRDPIDKPSPDVEEIGRMDYLDLLLMKKNIFKPVSFGKILDACEKASNTN